MPKKPNKKTNKKPNKKPKFIENPKPNASIEKKYRNAMLKQTKLMNKSLKWWLIASLKKNNAVAKLKKEFKKLSEYWEANFSEFAKKIAKKFINSIQKNSDDLFKNKGLDFNKNKKSALIHATIKARINENIALIKSIPKEQILRHESVLYNAISNFDMENLTQTLEQINQKLDIADKISENRIKTIARDQTKKATEALSQARAVSSGYEYYIWITANDERVSGNPNGKYPNVKGGHYHLDGRIYKYGENTAVIDSYGNVGTCGERVNCRCTSGAVYLMPNEELERVSDPEHGDYYRLIAKDTEANAEA